MVGGYVHVYELDVAPAHAGQRLGARLLDAAAAWGAARGVASVSLMTFRDVPWNAPYYARLGFVEVADHLARCPAHVGLWIAQAMAGLDMARRVFLIRGPVVS